MSLAVPESNGLATQPQQSLLAAATQDLAAWAESARAAHSVASSLVGTSFVPEAFRGKPNEATAAILAGLEIGLSPMAALRSFDIIQGTAAPRAITLRAVVQSAGHRIWTEESTPSRAVVCGQRRGQEQVEKSVWTIDRATKMKLTGKANWQNQPTAMLLARATSECARLIASDAILGIPYSAEEIEDNESAPTVTVTPAKRTTVRRAVQPVPDVPEPTLDEPTPEPEPVDTGEVITPAQSRKLHAALTEHGMGDRALGLAYIADTLGRVVESSKDLTKDEASAVIDALEKEPVEATLDDAWPAAAEVPA